MSNMITDFSLEYEFCPMPDAEESLAQVWDLILDLILEDIRQEQEEIKTLEREA